MAQPCGRRGEAPRAWQEEAGEMRDGGTGSCPPAVHGLQRSRRHTASQPPRIRPCVRMASMAYSEHVGVNRQDGGRRGEIAHWYKRAGSTASRRARGALTPALRASRQKQRRADFPPRGADHGARKQGRRVPAGVAVWARQQYPCPAAQVPGEVEKIP